MSSPTHFTDERLSDHHIDAVDPRQIHFRDALRFIGTHGLRDYW
jgi:hypothetical protein